MVRFLAHTFADDTTTEHATLREAQYAARKRQGYEHNRIPGQAWWRCPGLRLWEDQETNDRGMEAVVWDADDEESDGNATERGVRGWDAPSTI